MSFHTHTHLVYCLPFAEDPNKTQKYDMVFIKVLVPSKASVLRAQSDFQNTMLSLVLHAPLGNHLLEYCRLAQVRAKKTAGPGMGI